jgi:hypothetical protein
MAPVPYAIAAALFGLAAFVARAFAKFAASFALAAANSFRFGANSALLPRVERRPTLPLPRGGPVPCRCGHVTVWSAGAANSRSCCVPIDFLADRGDRCLDLLAFGFVANEGYFQGGSAC